MAKLVNARAGAEYYIVTDPVTIGRHVSNDICLPGPVLSRFHARIMVADGEYCIQDLGSTYGTYVNGERIKPNAPVLTPLRNKDIIQIGVLETLARAEYNLVFSLDEVGEEAAEGVRRIVAARQKVAFGRTSIESQGGILIARLKGAFRGPECEVMADDICACVAVNSRDVVIDFSSVTHMNSYAIGMFVLLRDRLKRFKVRCTFACAIERVYTLLDRAGLVELFGCWQTIDDARRELLHLE